MTKIYCKYTLAVHPSNDEVDYYEVPVYFENVVSKGDLVEMLDSSMRVFEVCHKSNGGSTLHVISVPQR